ncbi:MAG: hypothetical protein Q9220_005703 [cf. Caloplaca sp. 1 TL-2023]
MPEPIPFKREAADTDGDVDFLLVPAKGSRNPSTIQVSSKVLSLASPVFKALFQPRFKEGLALSSSKATQIALLDDDADAVTWLCHALHHHPDLDHEPELTICEQVAYLCDKYQCARAFLSWSRIWSLRWRNFFDIHGSKKSNLLRMMCMAYAFNDQEQYWHSVRNVFRFGTSEDFRDEEILEIEVNSGFGILPAGLIGM